MARKTISANNINPKVIKGNSKELELRKQWENKLSCGDDLTPDIALTRKQRKSYDLLVEKLAPAEILGNADTLLLSETSITLDRIVELDKVINKLSPDSDQYIKLMRTRGQLSDRYLKLLRELNLTPNARSQIAKVKAEANEKASDPLLQVLGL